MRNDRTFTNRDNRFRAVTCLRCGRGHDMEVKPRSGTVPLHICEMRFDWIDSWRDTLKAMGGVRAKDC